MMREQLSEFAKDLGEETRKHISPDGRRLLYPQIDDIASDIMLVENFR